jgi:hypothetical protein
MRKGSRLVVGFDASAPSFYILLELLHCFTLVVLPIADVLLLFLERLPHPKAFEGSEVHVGEHV